MEAKKQKKWKKATRMYWLPMQFTLLFFLNHAIILINYATI